MTQKKTFLLPEKDSRGEARGKGSGIRSSFFACLLLLLALWHAGQGGVGAGSCEAARS